MTPISNFNAAGHATPDDDVVQVQCDYLKREQAIGGYWLAEQHSDDWQTLYQHLADLINAAPVNIALQDSATRAMQMALLAIPWQSGDEVIISDWEYGANLVPLLQLQQRYQLNIKRLPNRHGQPDFSQLPAFVTAQTKAILITLVGSHNGAILNTQSFTHALRSFSGYVVADACQALGQIAVDVKAFPCDFLLATGRKFLRAPRGTGFLYASNRVLQEGLFPMVTDHSASRLVPELDFELRRDAKRFECWEANWSSRLGFKVALDQLLAKPSAIYAQLAEQSARLRAELASIAGLTMHDSGDDLSAIITFNIDSVSAPILHQSLRARGIETAVSYVDAGWFDFHQRQLPPLNRISAHVYNTEHEIAELLATLHALAG
ncbi:MAG: aminotransferase class V-fold PLP-dependent enzyme [Gammaproteobacteria bacterium]|nr:aminotransferase class V-fold PLP-dependent enzyme [Gammaproteobacteria bacterium]